MSGTSKEVYANDDGFLITSIDLPHTGQQIWVADSSGGATHLDLRAGNNRTRRYKLSDQKIGSISVNPTRDNFILTASNSRLVK